MSEALEELKIERLASLGNWGSKGQGSSTERPLAVRASCWLACTSAQKELASTSMCSRHTNKSEIAVRDREQGKLEGVKMGRRGSHSRQPPMEAVHHADRISFTAFPCPGFLVCKA